MLIGKTGRNRLKAAVVTHISLLNFDDYKTIPEQLKKQYILEDAIHASITLHHDRMFSRLKSACQGRTDILDLLKKIAAVSLLTDGQLSFAPTSDELCQCDLVNVGICQLV